VGHSHLPLLFESTIESASSPEKRQPLVMHALQAEEVVTLAGKRLIINPGSVGQPRDGDARASYALYDVTAGTFTLRRVAYDIKAAQRRISAVGLPEWLSERLALGK
jgi:diadenosine tetraphosphatase ApaH/serine/threonine PP2A family protein phosphatase